MQTRFLLISNNREHYHTRFELNLSEAQKRGLIEYLKGI